MAAPEPRELFDQMQSLFGDLFAHAARTRDLALDLPITLLEAAHGAEHRVELPRALACSACGGKGGATGATYHACATCDGRGTSASTRGMLVVQTVCTACAGTRGRWTDTCGACRGLGATTSEETVAVQIPPGAADGQTLRLAGRGNDLGEGPGDALLTIRVAPHPTLRRDGDDLRAHAKVPLELAEHGGEISVPWLSGTARVTVPVGMLDGTEVHLRGWGSVRLGSPYADPPRNASPYRASANACRGDLVVTLSTRDAPKDYDAALERELAAEETDRPLEPLASPHHEARAIAIFGAVVSLAITFALLLLR